MTSEQKQNLLILARQAIQSKLSNSPFSTPNDALFAEQRGLFVTLHKDGNLRGCIGYIQGFKNITESIIEMAQAAAFRDPRFSKVTAAELSDICIEISVLSDMILVNKPEDIHIGRDGLYLEHPYGSGLLLPQVALEWEWDRDTFLRQVCIKAGLHKQAWQDESAQLYRFSAEIFGESDNF
ncbi:MAG: AmmeMemoRadiSam system protein A [Candidatus Cloacimonetes bacterium HGW-Cloacimonetes-1]|jgi:AmmeMemoRadiSam system protein A|nr:MAG: AmmeMemoRadiSam system protein A [Candidatus Cloacimonetes bacterium HGW-Cloacimonetes-1]